MIEKKIMVSVDDEIFEKMKYLYIVYHEINTFCLV